MEANSYDNPMLGALATTLLWNPCYDETHWTRLMEADVFIPINILLWRIMITHVMDTGIMMRGGPETGNNLYGHTNFVLSSDGITKMIFGNYTFYSKAIVYDERGVALLEDIHPSGYKCGMNTEYMRDFNDLNFVEVEKVMKTAARSVISTVIPINEELHPRIMSLSGKVRLGALQYKEQQNTYNYSTCELSVIRWQLHRYTSSAIWQPTNNFFTRADKFNEIGLIGLQASYNKGQNNWTVWSSPQGHRGKDGSHPGCAEVWNGQGKQFPKFNKAEYILE